jgi:hypothetical protein
MKRISLASIGLGLVERALLLVEIVVARKCGQHAAVDLDDLADHAVHELAIVGGHQERAVVILEKTLQPDDRFDIQVVRRLVEQHDLGPHQKNSRQGHAHLPPTRKIPHVAVHHLLREAEAGHDLARPRFQRVAAQLVEARLHMAEAVDQGVQLVDARRVGHGVFQLAHLGGHG